VTTNQKFPSFNEHLDTSLFSCRIPPIGVLWDNLEEMADKVQKQQKERKNVKTLKKYLTGLLLLIIAPFIFAADTATPKPPPAAPIVKESPLRAPGNLTVTTEAPAVKDLKWFQLKLYNIADAERQEAAFAENAKKLLGGKQVEQPASNDALVYKNEMFKRGQQQKRRARLMSEYNLAAETTSVILTENGLPVKIGEKTKFVDYLKFAPTPVKIGPTKQASASTK